MEPHNANISGFGEQCPYCRCFFMTAHDMGLHERSGCQGLNQLNWKPSQFGSKHEIYAVDKAPPKLISLLQQQKEIVIADFKYALSPNKKWIIRSPVKRG